MATKQRSRSRRSSPSRDRGPRYVAPYLIRTGRVRIRPRTPRSTTIKKSYEASRCARSFRRASASASWCCCSWPALSWHRGPAGGHRRGAGLRMGPSSFARALRSKGLALGTCPRSVQGRRYRKGSTAPRDRHGPPGRHLRRRRHQDLYRERPAYNAALVPTGSGLSFFVTDALMRDFELIELEGVVAHCLARPASDFFCAKASRQSPRRAMNRAERSPARDWPTAPTKSPPRPSAIRQTGRGAAKVCRREPLEHLVFRRLDRTRSGAGSGSTSGAIDPTDISDLDDVELRARALEEW